jgi:hypothetical protein
MGVGQEYSASVSGSIHALKTGKKERDGCISISLATCSFILVEHSRK